MVLNRLRFSPKMLVGIFLFTHGVVGWEYERDKKT